MRVDGRSPFELRKLKATRNYIKHCPGSCLFEIGDTRVLSTATIEDKVPLFLKGLSQGWVTAEYGMLPGSCKVRNAREASRGRPGGRTQEVQRLIGRSLRSALNLQALGERTIWVDCDVIQADGGTRCAGITGGFIALYDACTYLQKEGKIQSPFLKDFVTAVSVGIVGGEILLDLCYEEDLSAEVDMNLVMCGGESLVEVQATSEKKVFGVAKLYSLIDTGTKGIQELIRFQKATLGVT